MKDTIKFLDLLDSSEKPFVFGCYDYRKEKKPIQLYGTLAECYPRLKELNDDGFDIYVTINETKDRSRKLEDIVRVRAVWCEDDTAQPDNMPRQDWPLPPSMIVESSEGRFHYYWLTDTTNFEAFDRVMLNMVANHGCDKKARDLSRVLRLPGFVHKKNLDKPYTCRIYDSNKIKHSWPAILGAFGMSDKQAEEVSKQVNAEFAYDTALKDLLSGENYHNNLVSISMSLTNRNIDRETQRVILKGLMLQAKKREGWEERQSDGHLYEMIDQAMRKVAAEKNVKTHFEPTASVDKLPVYPEKTMLLWPDPWPQIFATYASFSYDLVEPLIIPTIISSMSFMLSGKYLTERGRRPQFMFLNLCPSTGNKDTNSKNILRDLNRYFLQQGTFVRSPFEAMLGFNASITADTSFVESFDEKGNMFWLNTEATRIYQQLNNATNNSSVQALSDKMIEVVDGFEITGKQKAGHSVKSIPDPNCQVMFYAQPETIEKYLDDTMVDSGLFGRCMISILPDLKFDPDTYSMVYTNRSGDPVVESDFVELVLKLATLSAVREDKVTIPLTKEQKQELHEWTKAKFFEFMGINETFHKILDRTALFAEQLYTVVLAVCQNYDIVKGNQPRESIDLKLLFPILEYWTVCKIYSMRNLIDHKLDPLADEILEIIKGCIQGKIKLPGNEEYLCQKYGMVSAAQIVRIIKNRTKVLKKLNLTNKSVSNHISTQLRDLVSIGVLVEDNSFSKTVSKKYYGIANTD